MRDEPRFSTSCLLWLLKSGLRRKARLPPQSSTSIPIRIRILLRRLSCSLQKSSSSLLTLAFILRSSAAFFVAIDALCRLYDGLAPRLLFPFFVFTFQQLFFVLVTGFTGSLPLRKFTFFQVP